MNAEPRSDRPALEFWFDYSSTYSYPAALRIEALCDAAGVEVRWKPFLLGPIFASQGFTTSTFNVFPVRGKYMWRDVDRCCAAEGIPFRKPSVFPRHGVLASRVGLVAHDAPWGPEYTRAVYRANFAEDRAIEDPGVIADLLAGLGQPAGEIMTRALAEPNKLRLREQTEQARALGIFGAPNCIVVADGELFHGNDRIEQAISWALGNRPPRLA